MKIKVLAALTLAAFSLNCASAKVVTSTTAKKEAAKTVDDSYSNDDCIMKYRYGFYTAISANLSCNDVYSEVEDDSHEPANDQFIFANTVYNDEAAAAAVATAGANATVLSIQALTTADGYVRKHKSICQFGMDLELGYELLFHRLLVGVYANFGFVSHEKDKKIDGDLKQKVNSGAELNPTQMKNLDNFLMADSFETNGFVWRAGVLIGCVFGRIATYVKLGVMQNNVKFYRSIPTVNVANGVYEYKSLYLEKQEYKYNKVRPEVTIGLKMQLINNLKFGVEFAYAIGCAMKDQLRPLLADKYTGNVNAGGDAWEAAGGQHPALTAADVEQIYDLADKRTVTHKVNANTFTARLVLQYTFA